MTLSGPSDLVTATVEVHSIAINQDECLAIAGAVRASLSGYRGGQIQGSFLTGEDEVEEDPGEGFHVVSTFSVMANVYSSVATPDATAKITTGLNEIRLLPDGVSPGLVISPTEVRVCASLVDCAGDPITGGSELPPFDGGEFTDYYLSNDGESLYWSQPVDTSHFAAKNQANTFTVGPQTVQTGGATTKGVIVRAAASQTANFLECQDSSNNARILLSPNAGWTFSEGYYLAFKPGNKEFRFGASDFTGLFYFKTSNNDGTITLNPETGRIGGVTYLLGVTDISASEAGGAGVVNIGRRPSDNNAAVGAEVKCWTCTGQTSPALHVVAPGGGSSVMKINADGSITPASLADSSAANGTLYYSTTQSKLCFKDSGGTSNPLY